MTRKTSLEAYAAVRESGFINKVAFQVYDYIFKHGPITQKEVAHALGGAADTGGTYTGRFSELERAGVIEEVGRTTIPPSKRKLTVYDVTGRSPVEPIRKPSCKRSKCPECNGRGWIRPEEQAKEVHRSDAHLQIEMFGGAK